MKKLIVLLVVVFGVVYFVQHRKMNKIEDQLQLRNVELSQMKDSVLTYVTKNGQLISKIKSVEVDRGNLKDALEIAGIEKKDLRDQNIKLRNLVSVLQLEIEAKGQGQTTVTDTFRIVESDTIRYQKVNDWTDGYLSLYNASIENRELFFNYKQDIKMDLFSEKRKNEYMITANILNAPDDVTLTGNSIVIPDKKKFFERPAVWAVASFITGFLIAK